MRTDEVVRMFMVAGHYHICCCSRSLNIWMTAVAIFFEPLFFPSVYRGWVSSFFCFADHVAGIEISITLLSVIPQFCSGWHEAYVWRSFQYLWRRYACSCFTTPLTMILNSIHISRRVSTDDNIHPWWCWYFLAQKVAWVLRVFIPMHSPLWMKLYHVDWSVDCSKSPILDSVAIKAAVVLCLVVEYVAWVWELVRLICLVSISDFDITVMVWFQDGNACGEIWETREYQQSTNRSSSR